MAVKYPITAFKQLPFNVVMLASSRKVWNAFPQLDWVKKFEVPEGYDLDTMIRLVILLFDKNSPLIQTPNTTERAYEACLYAKVEVNKKNQTFPDWVQECVSGNVMQFNMITMYYLSMMEGPKVALIKSIRLSTLKLGAMLMQEASSKHVVELQKLEDEVKKREQELLSGYSISNRQRIDIDSFLIDQELDLRPEKMALVRENGKMIFEEFDVYQK